MGPHRFKPRDGEAGYGVSVVVEAGSPESAIKEGSRLLNIGAKDLAAKELSSFPKDAYKRFRVFPKKTPPEAFQERQDGTFALQNRRDGLYIIVTPPNRYGRGVEFKDVNKVLRRYGFTRLDPSLLKEALKHPTSTPCKIGPHQYDDRLDGTVRVSIYEGGRFASIMLTAPAKGGVPVDLDRVLEVLREKGVVYGIDEQKIQDVISARRFDEEIQVAKWLPPTPGVPGEIEFKFKVDTGRLDLKEDDFGRVDFRELHEIQNVREGDVLCVKGEAKEGSPGRLVTGEVVKAPKVKDVKLPKGKNTVVMGDGKELRAEIDGRAVLRDGLVCVERLYEVPGDLDMNVGNIQFSGDVIVRGDVKDGFRVQAEGDIVVYGDVEAAYLEAGGDVSIWQGVKGKGRATITSKGGVFTRFVENATIWADRGIFVEEDVMHSNLNSNGKIMVLGSHGAILGGVCRARHGVIAKVIGSPSTEVRTLVEVGVDPGKRHSMVKLIRQIRHDRKELEEVKLEFERAKRSGDKSELLKLKRIYELIVRKMRIQVDELGVLKEKVVDEKGGEIKVLDTVYPGVKISVALATLLIKEAKKDVVFREQAGEVMVGSGEKGCVKT